jgi:hypothetical protein
LQTLDRINVTACKRARLAMRYCLDIDAALKASDDPGCKLAKRESEIVLSRNIDSGFEVQALNPNTIQLQRQDSLSLRADLVRGADADCTGFAASSRSDKCLDGNALPAADQCGCPRHGFID